MTVPDERWLPIPGHEGYEVSDHGHVRSLDRIIHDRRGWDRAHKGRTLRTWTEQDGYLVVKLGAGRNHFVHRLVLLAFVGPCPEEYEALHDNGVHGDPRLSNLRWGTHSENCQDLVRHGTHQYSRRTHCPRDHPLAPPNLDPSNLKQGNRTCWACSLARHEIQHLRSKGLAVPDLQDQADRQYRRIMRGELPVALQERVRCPRNHPLASPNLVPAETRKGIRSCWACSLARVAIRNRRRSGRPEPDLQTESDRQYARIMHGEVVPTLRPRRRPS